MKKRLTKLSIAVIIVCGILIACINVTNDDSSIPEDYASIVIEEYADEYDFNTENILAVFKEYIPNYVEITKVEAEGTQACAIYCSDNLMYYAIFYSSEDSETPGEVMSIDTAEKDYKDRTRLYQSY